MQLIPYDVGRIAAVCVGFCAFACATLPTRDASEMLLSQAVRQRAGADVYWMQDETMDPNVQARIQRLLQSEMNENDAVQLALLNNQSLQATLQELTLAHADATIATTLHNPVVTVLGRFPLAKGVTNGEVNFLQDLVDVIMLPWRRTQASLDLERVRLNVTQIVLDTVLEVRRAFYDLQGAQQLAALRRKALLDLQQIEDLAELREKSEDVSDISVALGRATYQQVRLDLSRDELLVTAQREALLQLLGLEQGPPSWSVAVTLPTMPPDDAALENLEDTALLRRFDVAAARVRESLLREALKLTENSAWVGSIMVGGATARDAEGTQVAGPTLVLELPVFNRRQGLKAKLRGQLRQAQTRSQQLRILVRSQIRQAAQSLRQARAVAVPYETVLLPLRQRITKLSLNKLETTETGAWEVLLARQAELQTQREWVEIVRNYWIARAKVDHAAGGLCNSVEGATKMN